MRVLGLVVAGRLSLAIRALIEGAAEHACPVPPLVDYLDEGRSAEFTALCEGTTDFNGFYGHGIGDADATVTERFEFPE